MTLSQKLTRGLFLLAAPIVAGSTFSATPTLAATFASSSSTTNLLNFSQSSFGGIVLTETESEIFSLDRLNESFDDSSDVDLNAGPLFSISAIGASSANINTEDQAEAEAESEAKAQLISESQVISDRNLTEALNSTLSEVGGEGREYVASAQSAAAAIGSFVLDTASSFSFDFNISSLLDTKIDNPLSEIASAGTLLQWSIFGGTTLLNQTLLETLELSVFLESPDSDLEIALQQSSNNFSLTDLQVEEDFGDSQLEKSISLFAEGSYQRSFNAPTYLTVVQTQGTIAVADVPEPFEPSIVLSLLLTGGAIGMRSKLNGKKL